MKNKKLQILLPLLFAFAVIVGIFLGYRLHSNMPIAGNMFRNVSRGSLSEVLDLIRARYVDNVSVDSLGNTAIEEMLTKLDPHSIYIPAEDLRGVNEDLAGRFEGIGVEFNIFKDTVHVLTVLKGGPSDQAGLSPGDRIITVGDSVVAGNNITSDRIRGLLRGPRGTKVSVNILRGARKMPFTITRGFIPLYSLDAAYMLNNTTGYIRLNKFAESTYEEFMASLEKLQKEGMKELVLDLRDNGGGIMDEAVEIADEFLPGDKLIVYTEGKHSPRREYKGRRPGLFEEGKLVLLMNEGSASASEVLAGALQDWDRATIVGRRSFGKGLVQEQYGLKDGAALRLTVARYYTPLGRSIQKPYEDGIDKYHDEILERYQHGAFVNADSNVYANGKAFKTAAGKSVYGGGGISPDVFVAFDTLNIDTTVSLFYRKNSIGNFAYWYYIANKTQFTKYATPVQFNKEYEVSDDAINQLIDFARKDSLVIPNLNEKETVMLKKRFKSMLARQQWRNEGYYVVNNEGDPAIRKAEAILGNNK
ncbi:S41 family peptidase [Pollutibacter soli]|uniref:S41 family peptidase n=1 Tax=Pollutibacter soli TaxID=3034157 RepID=UPI00301349FF